MRSPIRLGIIGSSSGSALASASDCLTAAGKTIEWVVITDRECGLEKWAKKNANSAKRIAYKDADSFSMEAEKFFHEADCDKILLFYTRRVSSPLIDKKNVWNIHPALLPSFRGLNGVKDALAAGVRVIGATLHHVDAGLDTGEIVAQVAAPLPLQVTLEKAEHISYLQKVWLTLVWVDRVISPHIQIDVELNPTEVAAASPSIANKRLRASFIHFLAEDKNSLPV